MQKDIKIKIRRENRNGVISPESEVISIPLLSKEERIKAKHELLPEQLAETGKYREYYADPEPLILRHNQTPVFAFINHEGRTVTMVKED